jgi:hypothetical protein
MSSSASPGLGLYRCYFWVGLGGFPWAVGRLRVELGELLGLRLGALRLAPQHQPGRPARQPSCGLPGAGGGWLPMARCKKER